MGKYKLSEDAKDDLVRIHHYGVQKFGEAQADKYFFALFDHFELIAAKPFLYPTVDHIRPGYRVIGGAFVALTVSTTVCRKML